MSDAIYLIDPETGKPRGVLPIAFSQIGIKERAHLEQWVLSHPELLGEHLLVITTEYNRFDKSALRLDVLALDKNCTLVVVELKLDAARTLADLQAIRYAAFCSTMTTQDMIRAHAEWSKCELDEAAAKVRRFLESEEIPELGERPRIILAAGSLDDQELTSSVLWLRGFGVDITCVELTPYKLPESKQLILVPRVIIPLPEARDYVVMIEQKEVAKARSKQERGDNVKLWEAVADEFNRLQVSVDGRPFQASGSARGWFINVRIGHGSIHYEWVWRRSLSAVDVALHFESDDRDTNLRWLAIIAAQEAMIRAGVDADFTALPWGQKWAEVRFRLPFDSRSPVTEFAPKAASIMQVLIQRTYPILRAEIF